MENTTTNYYSIISVLVAVILIATVMMPIITATTQTVTTIEIDNEGADWLKLGYAEGTDFDFEITNDGADATVGEQSGSLGDMIYYADSDRVIFSKGTTMYMLTNGENPTVYTFTNAVSVTNTAGTLTILDGATEIATAESPTWAYVPDENGYYGFFTNGNLNLLENEPKVAVGSYAGVFAYNETIVTPDDVDLGLVMTGDYATGDVTWEVGTEETSPTDSHPSMAVMSSGYAEIPVMGANPSGTQVGDLYYTFSGYKATVVGHSSSIDWASFTSIPDKVTYGGKTYTITSIGSKAFNGCTNLALTSLPSGLTSIGNTAFNGCTNLALTSLPSGITSIGSYAFGGCTRLALTFLPSGLTSIKESAFGGCTNLALTSLPDGVTSIGNSAFDGCTNLALTSLPDGVTSIGSNAFGGCTNLALTSLPSGITSIGSSAFIGCTNLALTSLPDGVTSIESYAFKKCTNLALTSLPDGVTSIGSNAFNTCTNLALTSLPSELTSIDESAFGGCTNLALTSLPDGVTSIGSNAFDGCTNLALTSLPSGITSIGSNAFNGCTNLALTSLPDGVTSIGDNAFTNCINFETLILTTAPAIGTSAFSGSGIKEILNLGTLDITTTSYGLNADSVRSDIPAIGYIAPVSIHETDIVEDTSLSATLLKLLPVFMVLTVVIFIGYAMLRPDSEFVRSLKSR